MKVKKIFFDMDGVLADFDKGVQEQLHLPVRPQGTLTKEQNDELFYKMSQLEHFYGELDVIEGAKELFDLVYTMYPNETEILTGVPKPARHVLNAENDKREWVKQYINKDVVVHTVLRKDKPLLCSGKDCILIDDFIVNINEWEKSGGTGILHTSNGNTIQKLKELGIL